MKKAETVQAYFMRVDETTGQPYQGYSGEIANTLKAFQRYVSFDRSCMNMETITLSAELVLIYNEFGRIYDYPANRAWTDSGGRVLDIIHGNAVVVRHADSEFVSIRPSDVREIQKHLVPVKLVSGRRVLFLCDELLPEYGEGYSDAGAD